MQILILGSGGREHALAWKLSEEDGVTAVHCAPGNPGMAACGRLVALDPLDPAAVLAYVRDAGIDLTVVGPEQPLERGVVDTLRADGHRVVGPTREAAQLETSKAFAKAFMARHGVPTARACICDTPEDAYRAVDELGGRAVVKADGLAAGKGVTVADTAAQARAAIDAAMRHAAFGDAGKCLVIEERLEGPEVSMFVLCDGTTGIVLGTAQDHKRAYDGDKGPNTGGMGAFAPSPLVDDELTAGIRATIVDPVLAGMREEGTPFTGFLYCGLMLTADGPRVIEFNVRFGDPEAQVVMPLITSPLAPLLDASARGALDGATVGISQGTCVGVVLASGGYPGPVVTGRPITGLEAAASSEHVRIFHAGTALRDGVLVTSGGRVLTVTATGGTYREARARAYSAAALISFEGKQHRSDIGALAGA
jgi:phosphoribosylamine--glycine ligase